MYMYTAIEEVWKDLCVDKNAEPSLNPTDFAQ